MDLISQRLIYRKLTAADASVYTGMAMNKEVMKYITGKALSIAEAKERFQVVIETNAKIPEMGFYGVSEKEGNAFIGLGKFVLINDSIAEIGYSLLPKFWGRKYASEIAGCFIEYASGLPYITELMAVVNPANLASKKLLEKHGFTWFETGFLNEQPTEIHKLSLRKL